MRILLAEDDQHISVIMQIVLEKIGNHTVVICEDGESALTTALSETFDLFILDGMMPKKPGLQVAKDIRTSGNTTTPIIFLSAKSEAKDLQEFLSIGNGFIPKPFDPQTICARIDEILQGLGNTAG